VRKIRAHRGRQNDRDRSTDAKLHAHGLGHFEDGEHLVQHRYDDGAAADTEQPGKNSGDDAADDDGKREPGNLLNGRREAFCSVFANGTSGRDVRQIPAAVQNAVRDQCKRGTKVFGVCMRRARRTREMPPIRARAGHGVEQAVQMPRDGMKPRALCDFALDIGASAAAASFADAKRAASRTQADRRPEAATVPDKRRGPSSHRRRVADASARPRRSRHRH